jgi:hypothetical protein
MARSIETIQQEIVTQANNTTALGTLSTSTTAIWRLWTYIVASAIRLLEVVFDNHKNDVSEQLSTFRPHTRQWYATKALAFQYGASLVAGEDYFNNTGLTDDQIAAQKIIKRAAVVELTDKLQVKVAKLTSGLPVPLDNTEKTAFTDYINDIKDAGVRIEVLSVAADDLKLILDVYYDPKVLNNTGARLDGTSSTPIQDGVKLYLANLPFNGVFMLSELVDTLQKIEGVNSPIVRICQASFVTSPTVYFNVTGYWLTYAGYIKIEDVNLNINFIEYNL